MRYIVYVNFFDAFRFILLASVDPPTLKHTCRISGRILCDIIIFNVHINIDSRAENASVVVTPLAPTIIKVNQDLTTMKGLVVTLALLLVRLA